MKYKCIVSYDGFSFNGYQKQKHDKNTIQEVIENVLSYIFKEKILFRHFFFYPSCDKALYKFYSFQSSLHSQDSFLISSHCEQIVILVMRLRPKYCLLA